MENEGADCNSNFLMNGHNNDRSLPFEILSEIFSYLASAGPWQLRYVLFVARPWHNAAVHNPNLWTTILIDREFYSRCRDGWLAHGEAFIHCCFIRSGDLPITINVQYQDEETFHECLKEDFLSTVIGRVLGSVDHRHTNRCKALIWTCCDSEMDIYTICKIFPPQLEMLESFSLQAFVPNRDDDTFFDLHFPRCPNLKEVSLTDHCETELSSFFPDEDLERVEKLSFGNSSGWMSYDVLCISRYRNIRMLILRDKWLYDPDGQRYGDIGGSIGSTGLAHLPCLKTLSAIGYIPNFILKSIRAPALTSLRLETDEEVYHTLETIPTTLLTTLLSIYISFRPLPTPSWVPLLHGIISKAPCLSELFIAGWMKNDLGLEDWYRKLNAVCHYL